MKMLICTLVITDGSPFTCLEMIKTYCKDSGMEVRLSHVGDEITLPDKLPKNWTNDSKGLKQPDNQK